MRVPDVLAPSELRLAALLFGLALAGYGLRLGRHLSPDVARWLDREERIAAVESTGTPEGEHTPVGAGREAVDSAPAQGRGEPSSSWSAPGPPRGRPPAPPASPVDPNRASASELVALPGVGPVLARRIVEERERSGEFRGPEDLLRVRGIGRATLARLRPLLRFAGEGEREDSSPGGGRGAPGG